MNIVIASDIHGSAPHCLKLIKACYLEQAETVLLLGDILDGNKEVAEMLNSLNKEKSILSVRGNCDDPEDQAMLDFPIMAEYCLLFVHDRFISPLTDIGQSQNSLQAVSCFTDTPTLQPGSLVFSVLVRSQSQDETAGIVTWF